VTAAVIFLLLVIVRRRNSLQYLGLATLLIALAFGVWYTTIRNPVALP
jgi:hypothetical protein